MRLTVKEFEAQFTHVAYRALSVFLYFGCFSIMLLLLKWN